jgi:MFS family permease
VTESIGSQRSSARTWIALIAVTTIMATAAGGRFLVGLVFPELQHDLHMSHARLGSIVSLSVLIVGLSQPFVGWLVDRFSAGLVALVGLTTLGAGLVLGSQAHDATLLALGLGVLAGLGLATVSPTLLTRSSLRGSAVGGQQRCRSSRPRIRWGRHSSYPCWLQ